MATKDFTTGTVIDSDWLNDVDAFVYGGISPLYATKTELAAASGSSLIGYQPLVGAPTTVQDKLRSLVATTTLRGLNVKDYGAFGDGIADDTTAINSAFVDGAATGQSVWFPVGTYLVTQLTILTGLNIVGESSIYTVIKQKSGTNLTEGSAAMLYSPSLLTDDVAIENITLDGNSTGNSAGDVLVLRGARPRLTNVNVFNAAGTAIQTDWNGPSFRTGGFEGRFTGVTIDVPKKNGWVHRGPSDSHFDNIMIIDASAGTNNGYYGMYLDPAGSGSNGRFNNFHHWNRSTVTNIAICGMYVGFGGNTFTNSHFEGSYLPLNIPSSLNTFAACEYYATRGVYVISMAGGTNQISGSLWHYAGQPAYTGINLVGPSNQLDFVVAGDSFTAINFGDSSTGGNIVTIAGYLNLPGAAWAGVPSGSDIISISVGGGAGGIKAQGIGNSSFYAYQSSAQTLAATVWTPILCPNAGYDFNQEYNVSTSRFTCKIPGLYQFSVGMFFTASTANTKAIGISKNGVLHTSMLYLASTVQAQLTSSSPPILLAVGDYVEAVYYSGVVDLSIPGQPYVFFSGYRIK